MREVGKSEARNGGNRKLFESSGVKTERARGRDDSTHYFLTTKIGSENRSSRKTHVARNRCGEQRSRSRKKWVLMRAENVCALTYSSSARRRPMVQ